MPCSTSRPPSSGDSCGKPSTAHWPASPHALILSESMPNVRGSCGCSSPACCSTGQEARPGAQTCTQGQIPTVLSRGMASPSRSCRGRDSRANLRCTAPAPSGCACRPCRSPCTPRRVVSRASGAARRASRRRGWRHLATPTRPGPTPG